MWGVSSADFSAIMGIPGFANNTYRRLRRKVRNANAEVTSNVFTAAVAVHRAYGAGDGMPDSNGEGEEECVLDLGIKRDDDRGGADTRTVTDDGDSSGSGGTDDDDDDDMYGWVYFCVR